MDKLLEIINDHSSLMGIIEWLPIKYNTMETDIPIEEGVYKYFYDFKSYNKDEFIMFLENNYARPDIINGFIKILTIIPTLSFKYHVNSIDEFERLIISVWNANKFYDDRIIKGVLVSSSIIRKCPAIMKFNESLLPIYKDMVTLGMITNPNLPVGSSDERIYVKLPEDSSCYEYNLKVLGDSSIDWSIYRNGCNPLGHFCFKYNESKTETEKKYYHDVILTALSSSCSLFNDIFIKNSFKDKDIINYYLVCETDTYRPQCKMKDIAFSEEIKKFILTDKIFEHQLKLYKDINPVADEVIKRLNLSRNI